MSDAQNDARSRLQSAIDAADGIILGKNRQIRLALACLLARGHLLIEDLPGVGRTTLAHALAQLMGLQFSRIQFTSDLLPADIVGTSIYDRERSNFRFIRDRSSHNLCWPTRSTAPRPRHKAPCSKRWKSGRSRQTAKRGRCRTFFVVATQNPSHQIGTFALPESQLDRFLMRLELGYPDRDAERALLAGGNPRDRLARLTPARTQRPGSAAGRRGQCPCRRTADRLRAGARRGHAAGCRLRIPDCRHAPRSHCLQAAPGRSSIAVTPSFPKTCKPSSAALPRIACAVRKAAGMRPETTSSHS